jgi:hypothetical protein
MASRWRGMAAGGIGVGLGFAIVACGGFGVIGLAGAGLVALTWESGARAFVQQQTGGEVTFDRLSPSFDGLVVHGLAVHVGPGGEQIVRVDRLSLGVGPSALRQDPVRIARASADGVTVTLARDPAWTFPPTVRGILLGEIATFDWPAVEIGELAVTGITVSGTTPDGVLNGTADQLDLHDLALSLDGGLQWSLRSGVLGATRLSTAEQAIVDFGAMTFRDDGTLVVDRMSATATVRPDRTVDMPPVAADFTPRWLGGHQGPAEGPWLGIRLGWLPWVPRVVQLRGGQFAVTDGTFGAAPVTWDITVPTLDLGPIDGDRMPIVGEVGFAGGVAELTGAVQQDGRIGFDVRFTGGEASFFEPYVRQTLRTLSLALERGDASADLHVDLNGSQVHIAGTMTGSNVRFTAAQQDDAGSSLVGAGSRLFTANDDQPYRTRVDIRGDLVDPSFSPTKQIIAGMDHAVTSRVTGTIEGAVGTVKRTLRKVFGD